MCSPDVKTRSLQTKETAMDKNPLPCPCSLLCPYALSFAGAFLTALLLALSFPPAEISFFAWIALVPVLVTLRIRPAAAEQGEVGKSREGQGRGGRSRGGQGRAELLALWLAGLCFGMAGFFWIRHVTWPGMFLIGFYVSLYFLVFCVFVRWLSFGKGIPLALAAPLVWTALEYVRGILFGGLPWLFLAHTQYKASVVIQIADLAGTAGVTFWIVAVNGALADAAICLWRPSTALKPKPVPILAAAAGVLLLTLSAQFYGSYRLATIVTRPGPRIALIQGNVPQEVKNQPTAEQIDEIFARHVAMTTNAQSAPSHPDLVIWPETMAPPGLFDEALDLGTRYSEWRDLFRPRQRHSNLLVGSIHYVPGAGTHKVYNSVYFFPTGGSTSTQRYDKIHLVPFGEYVPLKPILGWIVGPFVPYEVGLTPGTMPAMIEVSGRRFVPVICFEDAFPELVADFARNGQKMDFIVNVTNEGWFKDGAELDQHLAIAVFRAVECRAGFVRAANTGISAFISPTGHIVSKLTDNGKDREIAGILHGVATTTDSRSPYLTAGEWLGKTCSAATALWALVLALPTIWKRCVRTPQTRGQTRPKF